MPGKNFGTYVDQLLIGRTNPDNWVIFNAVPLAALTIWGTLAGDKLRKKELSSRKLRDFALLGLIGVAAGSALVPVTPIIRRIATSSFVIETGGLCLLALALAYLLIDVAGLRKPFTFFTVGGMNPTLSPGDIVAVSERGAHEARILRDGARVTSVVPHRCHGGARELGEEPGAPPQ